VLDQRDVITLGHVRRALDLVVEAADDSEHRQQHAAPAARHFRAHRERHERAGDGEHHRVETGPGEQENCKEEGGQPLHDRI
jgi:hypothetical protein